MVLRALTGDTEVEVPLPDGARVAGTSWSPDGSRFLVTVVTASGSELWAGKAAAPHRGSPCHRQAAHADGGPSWTPEGDAVLCRLVPEDRGEPPAAPTVPTGPNIQETDGKKSPLRTYQDLLSSEHDANTWEYYATSELALLNLDGGEPRVLGRGIFSGASLSPDGEWVMTTRIQRPYSFLMPAYLFPQRIEVAPLGALDKPALAWDVPAAEGVPIGGVRTGARSFQWAANRPATLYWAEALDGGDPKAEVSHRDRWLVSDAPFAHGGTEFVRLEHRASGLTFFDDSNLVATGEYDRDRRWRRTLPAPDRRHR